MSKKKAGLMSHMSSESVAVRGHVVRPFSGHWYVAALSGPKINLQTNHGAGLWQSRVKKLEYRTHVVRVNSGAEVYCQPVFKGLCSWINIHTTTCILPSSSNHLPSFLPSKYLHSHIMCLALNSPKYDTCYNSSALKHGISCFVQKK